jgi:hypothetical protein
MLPQWLRIPLLAALVLIGAGSVPYRAEEVPVAPISTPHTMVVDELGRGTIALDGSWQFHVGDNPAWALPSFDDSNWEQLSVDKPWGVQGHEAYTGFAWYRLHIRLATLANQNLAILMPPVDDAYELYWDGQKIGNLGCLPPHAVWYVLLEWSREQNCAPLSGLSKAWHLEFLGRRILSLALLVASRPRCSEMDQLDIDCRVQTRSSGRAK